MGRGPVSAAGRAGIVWQGQDSGDGRSQMAIFSHQTDTHLHAPYVTQLQDTRNPRDNRMGQHSKPSCLTDRISSPPLPGRSMAGAFHYSGRGCAARVTVFWEHMLTAGHKPPGTPTRSLLQAALITIAQQSRAATSRDRAQRGPQSSTDRRPRHHLSLATVPGSFLTLPPAQLPRLRPSLKLEKNLGSSTTQTRTRPVSTPCCRCGDHVQGLQLQLVPLDSVPGNTRMPDAVDPPIRP